MRVAELMRTDLKTISADATVEGQPTTRKELFDDHGPRLAVAARNANHLQGCSKGGADAKPIHGKGFI